MTSTRARSNRSTKAIARRAFEKHVELHPLAHYTGILALEGLAHLAGDGDDAELLAYCRGQFQPFVAGKVSFGCNFPNYLCGGNGAALLCWKGLLPDVAESCRRYAEQIMNTAPRDPAGLLRLPGDRVDRVWIDAAFATVPFLLYSGLALNNPDYVDEAFRQATGLCDVLRDPANGLLHQSRGWVGVNKVSPDHWSRGNGWGALALAELVAGLPDDHPRRAASERALVDLLTACLRFQDSAGVWHQEMTETQYSYVETSGTGLILFALGVAVERNLMDGGRAALQRGLAGYSQYITADGSVFHTCRDCLSPGDGSIAAYMARPPVLNDPHAFGPVVLAFAQAHRLGIEHVSLDDATGVSL